MTDSVVSEEKMFENFDNTHIYTYTYGRPPMSLWLRWAKKLIEKSRECHNHKPQQPRYPEEEKNDKNYVQVFTASTFCAIYYKNPTYLNIRKNAVKYPKPYLGLADIHA